MKRHIPITLAVTLSVALVACTAPSDTRERVASPASVLPSSPDRPESTPSPIPSPVARPTPSPTEMTTIRVYFLLGGPEGSAGLVPVLREVPVTPAPARAAMEALLDGPDPDERDASPAISTQVPGGSRLLGLAIDDGVATVDLSGEFEAGNTNASQISRLGQVVYTLTQFSTVRSVAFRVDGRSVRRFGSEGIALEGPVGRADLVHVEPFQSMFEGILPAVFVDGPAWGADLGNPGRITGTANTYEAWFMVRLIDATGRGLNEVPGQATCGTGCRGTFDMTVAYRVSNAQWGTLRVLDGDESGATEGIIRDYPVWLTPGPPDEPSATCGC